MELFEKISKPVRIYQEAAAKIEDAIVTGKLKQGDRLPSERDLANRFGISQRTLREALRVVEEKGLIEPSQRGNIVKAMTTEVIIKNLDLLVRFKKISWNDMYEFRIDLDTIITSRAAEKATPADVQELQQIVEEQMRLNKEGTLYWDTFQSLDRMFHFTVSRIAGNPMHDWVLRTVISYFGRYYAQFRITEDIFIKQNLPTYKVILNSIGANDSEAAAQAAREHVILATRNLGNRKLEAIQAKERKGRPLKSDSQI
ncbi:MAG: FCD domain-containing protein [Desulfobacterales bacterium]|jgi:GntR family transcriptional repressor for pyruvate dehydrogenase complex